MSDREPPDAYRFETPPRHERVDERSLRAAYGPIRGYFRYRAHEYDDLRAWLDAARLGVPVDAYLARSVRMAGYGALGGCVLGLLAGLVAVGGLPGHLALPAAPTVTASRHPRMVVAAAGALGLVLGGGVLWLARRYYPRVVARRRARRVDLLLPHAVIFCYALVHGGLDLRDVVARLADEDDVYGTVADEFGVVDADIEQFGRGLFEALTAARDRSASQDFETFLDELVSVLEAGGDVDDFLATEAERHLELARRSQESLLSDLGTIAEVYIAVVFAGPVFLLVVLLVASFTVPGLLGPMRLLVYLVIPLLLLGFWAGLDYLMEPYQQHLGREGALVGSPRDWVATRFGISPAALPFVGRVLGTRHDDAARLPDDDRLAPYRSSRRRSLYERLRTAPLEAVRERPATSVVLTVPLGIGVAGGLVAVGVVTPGGDPVRATVGLVVVPFLLVAGSFAYLYERARRHDRHVRERFPAALEILADADRNDLPLGDAFRLVARRTGGVLETEFDRIARDFALTSDVPGVLDRFATRLDVPAVTRIVRLLDESFRATNDLDPILRIVADDLETRNAIRDRQRRNMQPYVFVVVLGVLVYVGIVILFQLHFLTVVDAAVERSQDTPTTGALQLGDIATETYRELFVHSALIQAVGNGLLLGKFRDNRLASGVKYAVGLVVVTTAAFLLFL